MRQHQPRRLARSQKPGIAGHLPDLAENPLSGLDKREIDVGANIEDADLERRGGVGLAQELGDPVLLAGVDAAAHHPSARRLDRGDERRQLLAFAAAGEYHEPLGGEFLCNCRANKIAGADDGNARIAVVHCAASRSGAERSDHIE